MSESERPTASPWRVWCIQHGVVCLTETEYLDQLDKVDELWSCPVCGRPADWEGEE